MGFMPLLEEEVDSEKQTPSKKSASGKSPNPLANETNKTIAAVEGNGDNMVSPTQTPPGDNEGFEEFTSRRNRRKKRKKAERKKDEEEREKKKANANGKAKLPRARDKAVAIKLPEGRAYADVLKQIKESASGEATAANICAVRKTQASNVLTEIRGKAEGQTALFEAVKATIGENVNVTCLTPRRTFQIRDIDCLTTEEEVEVALKAVLKETSSI